MLTKVVKGGDMSKGKSVVFAVADEKRLLQKDRHVAVVLHPVNFVTEVACNCTGAEADAEHPALKVGALLLEHATRCQSAFAVALPPERSKPRQNDIPE